MESRATLDDVATDVSPWPARGRRLFLCALLALVLAGAVGLMGVHTSTTSA